MADPDWIGPPVKGEFWSVDGRAVYYETKRRGSPLSDLHKVVAASGVQTVVADADLAQADGAALFDAAGTRAAFLRGGDVFVRDVRSGRLTQITRSPDLKAGLQFSSDGHSLSFRVGAGWMLHDFNSGLTAPVAQVLAEKDPSVADSNDLRSFQLRTFSTLQRMHDDAEAQKERNKQLRRVDATRAAAPFYLGNDVVVRRSFLAPDAHWLLVVTAPKSAEKGREGQLTRYVTESGYEEFETERVRVGRNAPAPQSLLLLDLVAHTVYPLATDALPGITDDPLKAIREENTPPATAAAPHSPPVNRSVWIVSDDPEGAAGGAVWSRDSQSLAIQVFSIDNKDRWIASVDLARHVLVSQHRLSDPAWVNWNFNEFGWLNDNRTLWYASEESGYVQLYRKSLGAAAHAITQGKFEVTEPVLSADGKWFYMQSNAEAPYAYDVYRVPSTGGELQRLTHLQGVERFALREDGKELLVAHSAPYVRTQLAVLHADGAGALHELTDTRTPEYKAMTWVQPQIVQVPSTHFDGTIYAKVYGADGTNGAGGAPRPAVIFVHGAGYLQDVHKRYSYYFREQMFNSMLVQRGYAVIDLDYRASAGYGRDWRTAIYRQMGHPELEDLLDGKNWLIEHAHVDPHRVGVYGGSYGGFMTLMALFRAPGEFGAGAALRPVTDWMQYDHNYTSAILNDPQVDPISYQRSSPLEFAANLRDPLLICHGVIDDNVLFEDSMRLYQRLIELHKDNFSLSPYPLDRHGFANADSWLDEYKRIYTLFETRLHQ